MEDKIVARYIKIHGKLFENPLPEFEYNGKVGPWAITVTSGEQAYFLTSQDGQDVEVEIGVELGMLRGI